ncbi:MAG: hypothetical protein KDN22_25595 [Verrucomicrobiae bacterium]|nr:hypothetical protein [Verrucomicrobiae bacterium]
MKVLIIPFLLVLVTFAHAQPPVVPAFERFYAASPNASGGRLLLGELNCTQCHKHPDIPPKGAPVLDGVGARLQASWIRDFLSNSHPGSTMPQVRGGNIEPLVHFLVSQNGGPRLPALEKNSSGYTGGSLFHRIGCLACHTDPLSEPDATWLVSLKNLRAKYSHVALVELLRNPLTRRPGGRMPDMRLTLREASDIAAYLLDTSDEVENSERAPLLPYKVDSELARAGAKIFASSGCVNCHPLSNTTTTLSAPDLVTLRGKTTCTQVRYPLSLSQTVAIQAALSEPIPQPDIATRVQHTLDAHHCLACHTRDGVGGPDPDRQGFFRGDDALGNEGKFPPPITGVGRKLQRDWLSQVLAGTTSARPYLHTRMPVFGEGNVGHLAVDLGAIDVSPNIDSKIAHQDGDAQAGRILMGTEGGVGCITCHGVGGRQGLAMKAISLDNATRRYLPDWFKVNLIHPMKTRPGTLMPSFWPDGVAGNKTILNGDTDRQIAAIWKYLDDPDKGKMLPPGFPDIETGQYEIIPVDRPVVQRLMMSEAGTHAIAVGFPEGIHFAFDADKCRLAILWKGRFLDGYNPWFSRMTPTAEPLSDDVKILKLEARPGLRFKGYTLDETGVPTFRYTDGTSDFLDRIEPDGNGGLTRSITRGPETETTTLTW